MIKVLLSIKPEFVDSIFNGSKRFEFRKKIFKHDEVTKVVIYASSPVKKVVGEFDVGYVIKEQIDILWERTKESAGIEEDFFYEYFCNHSEGYAVAINKVTKYKEPLDLLESFRVTPPQSFLYIR